MIAMKLNSKKTLAVTLASLAMTSSLVLPVTSVPFLTSNTSSVEASSVGVTKYVPKGLGSYWLYIDKNTTNKILKSALAGSVFIPGSGVTINTAKYLLALAGIWGSVNRGIIIKVINAHTTPLVSYSWQ